MLAIPEGYYEVSINVEDAGSVCGYYRSISTIEDVARLMKRLNVDYQKYDFFNDGRKVPNWTLIGNCQSFNQTVEIQAVRRPDFRYVSTLLNKH